MFEHLLNNKYKWISWVTCLDSGKSWPTVGFFAVTHGNEPVGLQFFEQLLMTWLHTKLQKGRLLLICVNLDAYSRYQNQEDPFKRRFVDENMNRIANKDLTQHSYERQRLQELLPIFDEIDIWLDLHSVQIWEQVIGITDKKYLPDAQKFFDSPVLFSDEMEKTWAMIRLLLEKGIPAYWLECGSHTQENGHQIAMCNTKNLLSYYGLLSDPIVSWSRSQVCYEFLEEVIPKTSKFTYTIPYENFTEISVGQVYGDDNWSKVINKYNFSVVLWLRADSYELWDGCGFLFKQIA